MWKSIYFELSQFPAIIFIFLVPCCIVGAVHWRRLPEPIKILVVFLWFDCAIEIGLRTMPYYGSRNNLPLLHVLTVVQIIVWPYFYSKVMRPDATYRKYMPWIMGVGLVLVVFNTLFLQGLDQFNSYAITLVLVVVILLALDFAFNFSVVSGVNKELAKILQRINASVLLYYCGSLFVFMFSGYAARTWANGYNVLWNINVVLNCIFYLVVLLGICSLIFKTRI